MAKKTAIITGVNGQDGAYLADLLISKGYYVVGAHRNKTARNLWRLDALKISNSIILEYLDLRYSDAIDNLIYRYKPDEFYNLAGLSSVSDSFKDPKGTVDINGGAVAKILESIRTISPHTKFYQASSSEMFGKVEELPITENSVFHPRSPYAAAKIFAHNLTVIYREAYGLYACSGILFNHESPLRSKKFVTSKIINGVYDISKGKMQCLKLGNINAKRDWGYAKEYVHGMWLMLQQDKADDYILATGNCISVREFVTLAFSSVNLNIEWRGEGLNEYAVDQQNNVRVRIDPDYFRPSDIDIIYGDASMAESCLGWKAKTTVEELVALMINEIS